MTTPTPDNAASATPVAYARCYDSGKPIYDDVVLPNSQEAEMWAYKLEPLYSAATVAALEAEVERLRQHSYDTEQAWLAERVRAEAAERRVAECLRFIDGVRDDLHNRRTADWFPEGAHDAATSMSEDMRLIGNACTEFDPYQDTGARAK